MATPWLSFPVALIIAALVTVGTMSLFSTDAAGSSKNQDPSDGSTSESELNLLSLVESGTNDQKIAAIFKIAEAPKDLARIVPALGKAGLVQNDMVRTSASLAIKKIGAPASEHIEGLLAKADRTNYGAAAFVAEQLGTNAKQWLPKFAAGLKSDDAQVVMSSLFAMRNMGKENLPYLDDLISHLNHKEFNIQVAVCRTLIGIGPDANPAQDELVRVLDEGVLSARSWASMALGAIGPTDKHDVVSLLSKKLSAFTQIEKERALIGLAYIGPKATDAIDEVKRLMNDPSKSTQAQAALTYYRISDESEAAVKVLAALTGGLSFKRDAIQRLGEMGPAAIDGLPALMKALKDEETDVKEMAVIAIGQIGPNAKAALPAIKRMLNNSDKLLVQAVEATVKQLTVDEQK